MHRLHQHELLSAIDRAIDRIQGETACERHEAQQMLADILDEYMAVDRRMKPKALRIRHAVKFQILPRLGDWLR